MLGRLLKRKSKDTEGLSKREIGLGAKWSKDYERTPYNRKTRRAIERSHDA